MIANAGKRNATAIAHERVTRRQGDKGRWSHEREGLRDAGSFRTGGFLCAHADADCHASTDAYEHADTHADTNANANGYAIFAFVGPGLQRARRCGRGGRTSA